MKVKTYLLTYLFSLLPRLTAGTRPVSTPVVSPALPPLVSLEERPSSRRTRRWGLRGLTSSSAVTSTDDWLLLVCIESLAPSPVRQAGRTIKCAQESPPRWRPPPQGKRENCHCAKVYRIIIIIHEFHGDTSLKQNSRAAVNVTY